MSRDSILLESVLLLPPGDTDIKGEPVRNFKLRVERRRCFCEREFFESLELERNDRALKGTTSVGLSSPLEYQGEYVVYSLESYCVAFECAFIALSMNKL